MASMTREERIAIVAERSFYCWVVKIGADTVLASAVALVRVSPDTERKKATPANYDRIVRYWTAPLGDRSEMRGTLCGSPEMGFVRWFGDIPVAERLVRLMPDGARFMVGSPKDEDGDEVERAIRTAIYAVDANGITVGLVMPLKAVRYPEISGVDDEAVYACTGETA